jgi:hypothetical protein
MDMPELAAGPLSGPIAPIVMSAAVTEPAKPDVASRAASAPPIIFAVSFMLFPFAFLLLLLPSRVEYRQISFRSARFRTIQR